MVSSLNIVLAFVPERETVNFLKKAQNALKYFTKSFSWIKWSNIKKYTENQSFKSFFQLTPADIILCKIVQNLICLLHYQFA